MPKYRKKPVVIDAWLIADIVGELECDDPQGVAPQVLAAYLSATLKLSGDGLDIRTLEGTMHGRSQDFLIMGVQGELYPCAPEIFAATYEPAEVPA